MSMSQATAAPAPVRLAGKEYSASPIDFDGLGELEEYARARILSVAAKSAESLPPSQRDAILDRAIRIATGVTFDGEEFTKYLTSSRGMVTVLAISLRRTQPGVTPSAISAMVKGRDDELIAAFDTILRISGFGGEEKPQQQQGGQKPGEADAGA